MKKLAIFVLFLCATGATLHAGPAEYSSGKGSTAVAPSAAECPVWTGFYAGVFGGYKLGAVNPRLNVFNLTANDIREIEARGGSDFETSGAELGGLLGYNHQWNNWVLGAEVSGGYLWLRDSKFTGAFFSPDGNQLFLGTSLKSHYLITAGPRIGYALCRWLPYATGGLAVGDIDFSQRLGAADYPFRARNSVSTTKAGWFVGGGLQYAITEHWSARAQYQYIDLGNVRTDESLSNFGYSAHGHASLVEHNVSFALIYGF